MHASGNRGLLLLCDPVLIGAAVQRTKEVVTCLTCIVLEE